MVVCIAWHLGIWKAILHCGDIKLGQTAAGRTLPASTTAQYCSAGVLRLPGGKYVVLDGAVLPFHGIWQDPNMNLCKLNSLGSSTVGCLCLALTVR